MIKVKKAKPVSARQIKAVQWLRKTHGRLAAHLGRG